MKRILLTVCYLLFILSSFSQTLYWTWVNGDSTINHNGVYGMKGTPASGNLPGAREHATGWRDQSNNLWLLGGDGYAASGSFGYLNDLWKYNIATDQWAWMSGDSTLFPAARYGTKGVPDPANKPGSKVWTVSWIDKAGNLWDFGGVGNQAAGDDLWKYTISTGEWTWMTGDSTVPHFGVYGTKGVPATANNPGSRQDAVGWTDTTGNFWLFGGIGYAASTVNQLNDLWKYNVSTNQWTWVNGDSVIDVVSKYGAEGTPAAGNKPGAGFGQLTWTDNADNLWLFGGYAFLGTGNGDVNALWKYNIGSNEWTWVDGDTTAYGEPVYGTQGTPAAGNIPPVSGDDPTWKDNSGNLWLYVNPNDLWKYNIGTNEWTWIIGDTSSNANQPNVNSVHGTEDIGAAGNTPGTRGSSVSWTDSAGNFWLFGGFGNSYSGGGDFNDLWTFRPGNSINGPVAQFSALPDTVCAGSPVTFTDRTTGSPTSWNWTFAGGTPDTSTKQNPTVTYNVPGTYPVKLVASNPGGADSLTKNSYIVVNPLPVPVVATTDSLICSGDSTQVCTADTFTSYLWNTGGTSFCTYAAAAGGYWVTVTDANHCSAVSGHQEISVYPVPSVSITVQGDTLSSYGQVSYQWILNGTPVSGDTSPVFIATQPGSYTVQVTDSNGCKATSNVVTVTGVENLEEEGVSLFPNPSTGSWQLVVGNYLAGSALEVFDEQGRLVWQSAIRNQKSEIQLEVASGVYYLRISNASMSTVRKMVKQ